MWDRIRRRTAGRELPRRVTVYAPPAGSGPADTDLGEVMARCRHLREAVRPAGIVLDGSVGSLADIEDFLGRHAAGGPAANGLLWVEAAGYLGTVICARVRGARWELDAHRKPVVRLPGSGAVDVLEDVVVSGPDACPLTTGYARVARS